MSKLFDKIFKDLPEYALKKLKKEIFEEVVEKLTLLELENYLTRVQCYSCNGLKFIYDDVSLRLTEEAAYLKSGELREVDYDSFKRVCHYCDGSGINHNYKER